MKRSSLPHLAFLTIAMIACSDDDNDNTQSGSLSNPDFANNINGWIAEDPPSATVGWSAINASGASGSGSALVTNTSPGPGNGAGMTQCVRSITAGASYTFGGKVLYPTGQARTGELALGLRWRAGSNCSGAVLGTQPRLHHNTPGAAWVSLTSAVLVAPDGVVSADFIAYPSKVEAGGTLVGNFDDLFITISSSNANMLVAPSAPRHRE